jgi:uncharacterized membrane protein
VSPASVLRQIVRHTNCVLMLIGFFLLMMLSSVPILAQTATILGTVTDPSGAAVPNVTINLTNVDTSQTKRFVTNSVGQYVAPDLPIGHYNVSASAANFQQASQQNIALNVGDRRRVDFGLKVGTSTQTVTVEAATAAVQSDTGEQSFVITGTQVRQLATNGRSMYTLESLTPGASSIQQDFQIPTSAGGDANVSFNGLREGHNLWLIDGGEASDRGGAGGSDVMPSIDAIAEFRTLTSNYSAEYGLSSAGTLSTVIRSGTKSFHAEAWYFGRNDALDARNFFNPAPEPVAKLRFHIFGFNVGGPLSLHPKSSTPKTFFFFNMEWRRLIQQPILNQTVPLASEYPDANGAGTGAMITSPIHTPNNVAGWGANCPGGVAPVPDNGSLFPSSTGPNGTVYAIPSCLIAPNAQSLLSAGIFPKPTSGTQFIGGNNVPTNVRQEIVRVDHTFNDKFSIFGHFIADSVSQTYGTSQWSGDNVPTVFDTFNNPGYHAVVHATDIIRPNLLNEVAFNYNGNRINIVPQGVFQAPSSFTFNRIFSGVSTNTDNRIPSINLSGSTTTNYTVNWMPWKNTADDYQVRDDVSWTKGAHQFKFGASFALYKKVQDYFAETQGGFTFDGSFSGNDFADFLLGYAQKYNEFALKGTGYWNNISPAAYIQDNWRATNRLTLNLGLRWDGIPHTYEANGNQSNFYPNLWNPADAAVFSIDPATHAPNFNMISPTSPGLGTSPVPALQSIPFFLNGIGISGQNGIPKGLVNNTWNAFGPRIGFALDLTGHGTTVLRGGFGTMYERIQGNDMYNAANNSPFNVNLNINNVLFSNPHVGANPSSGTITAGSVIPVSSLVGLNKQYKVPTSYQYSLGLQQSLGRSAVFSLSYVGNQNRWQSYSQEQALPPQSLLPGLVCANATNAPACGSIAPVTTPFNGTVNYLGYSSVLLNFTGSNSNYNGLQAEVHGRIAHDLQLQAAYTYSRAIDPTTGNLGGGDSFDLDHVSNPYLGWRYDRGPSPFDRTHIGFVNFVYDIPLLKSSAHHVLRATVGGWSLSGVVIAQTGTPLNIGCTSKCGASYQSVANIFPGGDVLQRPDLVGNVSYPKTVNSWFNPSVFAAPPPGTWGTLGFDALRGPGRQNWNLALFKEFVINEDRGSRVEFRAESFNTWNHTQFGGPGQNGGISANLGSSNFGAVTAAWDPRVFQLGLKLIY